MTDKKPKPGPEAETVAIEGDWKEAVRKALGLKRPKDGWPSLIGSKSQKSEKKTPESGKPQ